MWKQNMNDGILLWNTEEGEREMNDLLFLSQTYYGIWSLPATLSWLKVNGNSELVDLKKPI